MPLFYNNKENYFLATNYKVMYGTLCRQTDLKLISNKAAPFVVTINKLLLKNSPQYLLVRNPYDRLVSFYMHKIRQNKFHTNSYFGENLQWQKCQKLLFPMLDITKDDDNYTIGKKMSEVRFDDFIRFLPTIYRLNPHLWPQFWSFNLRIKRLPILKINFQKIILLEEDTNFIKNNLKIDTNIRINRTKRQEYQRYYTVESYRIVNRLYKKDFRVFGYKQEDAKSTTSNTHI